ncbi:hypothetical protein KY343_00650 [Candidatus Woesearchaeota archaeon]|nr:hypothetical protein [Candidatus Woesearchaeota archaeon]
MKKVNILTYRKGQISLFIIIGLIVLMMFVAIFYLVNSLQSSRIEKEVRKTTSSVLKATTIRYLGDDCLREILKEGLITLGKQGGYFYENQSGYEFTTELPRTSFRDSNVSYLIYPRRGEYYDWWPCSAAASLNKPSYCRFSTEIYPSDKRYGIGFSSSALPLLATNKFSMKSQLAKYIEDEIPECLNLTEISAQFPGYNVSGGEMNIDINFGVLSVNVNLDYPITIQFQDYEPILEIFGFKAEVPVRFSKIYDIAEKMIDKEVFFLDSGPYDEAIILLQYSPQIKFRIEEQGHDNIFIINDSYSQIDGKDYVFQFARKNRPPVLDYISKSPSYLYNESGTDTELYDYLTIPNLYNLNITPRAVDPDEDTVFYSSQCSTIPNLTQTNIQHMINYNVTMDDVGLHNLTIAATDLNLSDKQEIRLLVDKPLTPNAAVYNICGGNTSNIYSREDPFFLNATPSVETLDPFASYSFFWADVVSPQNMFVLRTDDSCVVLPLGIKCEEAIANLNIVNITDYNANNYLPILDSNPRNLFLRVNLSYSELSQLEDTNILIIRKDCIPYRSDTIPIYNPSSNADPTNINVFFGDHSCCLGDINDDPSTWELADNTVVCDQEFSCAGVTGVRKKIKQRYCSGNRGNICDGAVVDTGIISDICGCNMDGHLCINRKANGFTSGVWCYGTPEGCGTACTAGGLREAVDSNGDGVADDCGCSGHKDFPCDGDFDGIFEGKCSGLAGGYSCQS